MLYYVIRRFLYMILLVVVLSVVVFAIIQLPPGDYATYYINQLKLRGGGQIDEDQIANFRRQYGLDLPMYAQYLRWVGGLARGYLGRSFYWNQPINDLLAQRLPLTVIVSLCTLVITYAIAVPIGIFSATHQYSVSDYALTVIGFVGISVPNFLFALIMMYVFYEYFGVSASGLFSAEYASAAWSWDRVKDLIAHLWAPIIVVGTAGTAGIIRVMRATLLDELSKPYVETARAKGVSELQLLLKYPVRVAINPILSTIGWTLPGIFSGAVIVSVVMMLPTVGPLLLNALQAQDFYVAGSIVMILTVLTLIGTFISDILLAWADPRVRFD
ncbi:MAG: ABC transporter permease [Chloroflexi bacterium]|nr:ABC transporter permease [Chloroflexota bacterium]